MNPRHLLNLAGNRLHTLPLIVLYLTDGCNSRCITCDIWRNPRRNMSLELVNQIVSAVQDLQIRWVLLSGGEAMQHPHWPQIARKFREAGVHVMLLTNGLLLQKQATEVHASVDEVIVSLDGGTATTYEAIRGVDAFDLVLNGIQAVRAARIPVTTRTTLQHANFREIPAIIDAAKAVDVNHISFLTVDVSSEIAFGPRFEADPLLPVVPANSSALTVEDVAELATLLDSVEADYAADFASGRITESPTKLRRMLTYFGAVAGQNAFEPPRCNAPHISTVIEVDGTLRPCYFLPAYGKLNGQVLGSAINGDVAQQLRQAYRTGQRPECERCVCPLYKGPRALLNL